MRNVIPIKKRPPPPITVIILAGGFGRNMRSYGPKSLLRLTTEICVIDRQIDIIKEKFPDSEIIVVTGFESNKLLKHLGERVKTVENHVYENTSELYSISLALRVASFRNILVVYGDLVFGKDVFEFGTDKSSAVIGKMRDDCVGINEDSGFVQHFEYGLKNKWCQIAHISPPDYPLLRKFATNREYCKLHTFEIFNKMLDFGMKMEKIDYAGEIIEIECSQDLELARKIK